MRYVASATIVMLVCFEAAQGSIIAWQDEGLRTIFTANADGTNVRAVVSLSSGSTGLDVDFLDGKIYWTVTVGSTLIQWATIDGSGVETLISTGLQMVTGIVVDNVNGHIYWADQGPNKNSRASLDGSGRVVLVALGAVQPHDIGLDLAVGKMYWTDSQTNKIQRANLDGSGIEDLLQLGTLPGNPSPRGLAVDPIGQMIYWAKDC